MWTISKQFDFCYGHRVWSQQLNAEFSLDSCLACRHLHGHQGTIKIHLEGEELKDGMVTDFKHLNWFKKWLDDVLDHKMILDVNDPALPELFPMLCSPTSDKIENIVWEDFGFGAVRVVAPWIYEKQWSQGMKEIFEGLVFVDFVPTSENLSQWIHQLASEKMKALGVRVSKVELYETPKSCSVYSV